MVTASVVFATAVPLASAGTITPTPSASSTSSPSTSGDHVLPVLDRGAVHPSALTYPSASTRRVARTVVVHHGDTLWDMAARHLPGQVSNARIAAAWPQWYRLNRSVIGFDPNLIRPGMRIRTPAAYGEVTR